MLGFTLIALLYLTSQYLDGRFTRALFNQTHDEMNEWNPIARNFIRSDRAMLGFKLAFSVPTLIIAGVAWGESAFYTSLIMLGLTAANSYGAYTNYEKLEG